MKHYTRRDFVSGVAAAAAVAALPIPAAALGSIAAGDVASTTPASPPAPAAAVDAIVARPFDLARVRLRPGLFRDALEVNRRYLLGLDPDRLLHMFRVTAGLPSSAAPLGGWEAPDNELRGHFVGHYLSACALMGAQLGDPALHERGSLLVTELAKCQAAHGNGYLSAFPEELFDRLRTGRPVWAPFYTLHKIMAGLLDMHTLAGNAQALQVLEGMGVWTRRWAQPLGDEQMQRVLEVEYGGMNELLYNLAAVTGRAGWSELAHRFDHEVFFAPLALGRDELKGLHANTHIPQVIGAARRYEVVGDGRARDVADYFWREVTGKRAYATGGTSDGEDWNTEPGQLSKALSQYSHECCCSYNMLKLTRHVFGWTADPRAADYYERTLLNAVLGTEHPADGDKLYYVPMASGYWKYFGTPLHDFWCCTGTGAESHAKFGDSIYFHDDAGVWVNLFIASELNWSEKGLRLVQDTRFPDEDATTLTIHATRPTRAALRLRVPYWATNGGEVTLNGRRLEGFASPASYFVLDRTWKDGDVVRLTLPLSLHVHAMDDDPALQALMYGPLVLAGRLGTEGLTPANIRAEPTKPRMVPELKDKPVAAPTLTAAPGGPGGWIKQDGRTLVFHTGGVELIPFNRLIDERYAIYWRVKEA